MRQYATRSSGEIKLKQSTDETDAESRKKKNNEGLEILA